MAEKDNDSDVQSEGEAWLSAPGNIIQTNDSSRNAADERELESFTDELSKESEDIRKLSLMEKEQSTSIDNSKLSLKEQEVTPVKDKTKEKSDVNTKSSSVKTKQEFFLEPNVKMNLNEQRENPIKMSFSEFDEIGALISKTTHGGNEKTKKALKDIRDFKSSSPVEKRTRELHAHSSRRKEFQQGDFVDNRLCFPTKERSNYSDIEDVEGSLKKALKHGYLCEPPVLNFCHVGRELEPCLFAVKKNGCTVKTHYCTLHFPPECVREEMEIKLTPVYYSDFKLQGRAFISPHIKFECKTKMSFIKSVEISLKTSYSAKDIEKPVEVQIMRKTGKSIEKNFCTTYLKDKRQITFTCQKFCQLASHVAVSQQVELMRSYYCAGHVRDQYGTDTAIVEALIYEDTPATRQDNIQYLAGKNILIGPECFTVGFPGNLEVELEKHTSVEIQSPGEVLALSKYFGKKLDSKLQFRIQSLRKVPPFQSLSLKFKVHIYNNLEEPVTEVNKTCFLRWNVEPDINDQKEDKEAQYVSRFDDKKYFCEDLSQSNDASDVREKLRIDQRVGPISSESVLSQQPKKVGEYLDEEYFRKEVLDTEQSWWSSKEKDSCSSDKEAI